MKINKKVTLDNTTYYIELEVYYNKDKHLCLKNWKEPYYDGGDLSIVVETIEENYTYEKRDSYDKDIAYLGDCLYIYNRIPIISGIYDVYKGNNQILPGAFGYISKEELDEYIKEHNITMIPNEHFELSNQNRIIEKEK